MMAVDKRADLVTAGVVVAVPIVAMAAAGVVAAVAVPIVAMAAAEVRIIFLRLIL